MGQILQQVFNRTNEHRLNDLSLNDLGYYIDNGSSVQISSKGNFRNFQIYSSNIETHTLIENHIIQRIF